MRTRFVIRSYLFALSGSNRREFQLQFETVGLEKVLMNQGRANYKARREVYNSHQGCKTLRSAFVTSLTKNA